LALPFDNMTPWEIIPLLIFNPFKLCIVM